MSTMKEFSGATMVEYNEITLRQTIDKWNIKETMPLLKKN